MNNWRLGAVVAILVLVVGGMSSAAFAQGGGGGGGRNRGQGGQGGQAGQGGRGNRGNFDPAQMQQRRLEQIKQRLGSPDDEWTVLSPKIEKILTAQTDARGGGRGGRGNRGGNQAQPTQPQSELAKAMQDLRTALDDKSSSPDTIASKVSALRKAKDNAKNKLLAAQKEVKDLLTARQEATLVADGLLE